MVDNIFTLVYKTSSFLIFHDPRLCFLFIVAIFALITYSKKKINYKK